MVTLFHPTSDCIEWNTGWKDVLQFQVHSHHILHKNMSFSDSDSDSDFTILKLPIKKVLKTTNIKYINNKLDFSSTNFIGLRKFNPATPLCIKPYYKFFLDEMQMI